MLKLTGTDSFISHIRVEVGSPNPGGPKEFADSIARQRERIALIAKAVGITAKQ